MSNRVVIASQSEKLISTLRTLLMREGYEVLGVVSNGYDLARSVKGLAPKIVIIDDELTGISVSLIETLVFEQQAVLLVGKPYQKVYYPQNPYFEFCEKPLQPSILLLLLRLLTKYADTVRQLESKINRLEKKQKEERLLYLAKQALQTHEQMSEDEAHRYIQKRSMELRISKAELAKRITKRFQKND